ncbi:MAG: phosphonate C-P lyase system protein PhnH [Thermodesulfobacteriota bacterium]|nr:phosphonate C-P lyase system protein PhnH [Thermodesulfobacteriota bacterium]
MTRATIDTGAIPPGFSDPVIGAQQVFRKIVEALAHPGRIVSVENGLHVPGGVNKSTAAACLALLDFDTPLWLDEPIAKTGVSRWLAFHCGVPTVTAPETALFAIFNAGEQMPRLQTFDSGTAERPDLSTTLVVQVADLEDRGGFAVQGPGINGEKWLNPKGLPLRFWEERNRLCMAFPRGIDIVFTCGEKLAALPRTTTIKEV